MKFGEWPAPAEQAPSQPEQRPPRKVPAHEMRFQFVRSSGKGGQNVNKVNTKTQLWWNVGASQEFTEDEKAAIRAYAGGGLNERDEIKVEDSSTRSQGQNRANAEQKLQDLVAEALKPVKERKPTKVSDAEKKKRLDDKRRNAPTKWRRDDE